MPKAIKDKKTGVVALRDIRAALGAEAFNLITDGMSDAQVRSLATKLDKHNSDLSISDPAEQRRHVLALVEGAAEPMEKPKTAPKRQTPKKQPAKKSPTPTSATTPKTKPKTARKTTPKKRSSS